MIAIENSVDSIEPVIVRVAVAKPLRTLFDYCLPPNTPAPSPGCRVRVAFGRQVLVGVCVELGSSSGHSSQLKPLLEVLDTEPLLSRQLLELLSWAAAYYHHPIGEALFAAIPVAGRAGKTLTPRQDPYWQVTAALEEGLDTEQALRSAPKQQQALQFLLQRGGARESDLRQAGFNTRVISALNQKGFVKAGKPRTHPQQQEAALSLSDEQTQVLKALQLKREGYRCALLQGVTGSGKTEVYLQAIEQVLAQGKQALVLVPEIALTPQTLSRFQRRFSGADVIHSGLAKGTRAEVWWRCRNGISRILIGTRSAVFTEFKELGLIVVDEEHDGSFKQQDGFRYSARDLAVKRAQLLDIPLVLGSATPSLESLFNARQGRYQLLQLTRRAGGATPPVLKVMDLRGQTLKDGISDALARQVAAHLDRGNQVLLFINRRGFAPTYLCALCGWSAECPRCDSRLTLHHQPNRLKCHHCDYTAGVPQNCPACNQPGMIAIGVGTQRSEAGLKKRFPDVPVIRLDRDSSRSPLQLEQTLERISSGEPAILVGTQMIAKGHHFPNVTLVGILNADAGFYSADFKAPEHTAQLIVQVAGRAGRAEKPGEVLIQSYNPDNPILQALVMHGYEHFSAVELSARKSAQLPPYSASALIRADAPTEEAATRWLNDLSEHLKSCSGTAGFEEMEILGPAPAPLKRRAGRHRCQALLLSRNRQALHRALALVAEQKQAGGIRWSLDVDPFNTF